MLNRAQVHLILIFSLLVGATASHVFEHKLELEVVEGQKTIFLDDEGEPLNERYLNQWNSFPQSISDFPRPLVRALLTSEDKRFYSHHGVDVVSKVRAVCSNLKRFGLYQGGSTISEQVVRILAKEKRSVWNRWIQMWQALLLEKKYTKEEILAFYLNQVPFASHRRGFHQAAKLYFNRNLDTLSVKEILALVVLVKSPSRFDIRKGNRIEKSVQRLANSLGLSLLEKELVVHKPEQPRIPQLNSYFNYIEKIKPKELKIVRTSIQRDLQLYSESILQSKLDVLEDKGVRNGALVILNHQSGEILSHVVVSDDESGMGYDTTLVPRQPGSTLKPFLYSLAFEGEYHTGSMITDSPLETTVSGGLHQISNYSRTHYGDLTLREALANSLNVPAIKLVRDIGEEKLYSLLVKAGLPLQKEVGFYGDGLALGNIEVSLMDMMKAWSCLVRRGVCKSLRHYQDQYTEPERRILSIKAIDMTLDILSDPEARKREFGRVEFSHQVGFKTGTSTDYRDSWAFVFNSKYLIGVWMGNLDGSSMDEVTGSMGALRVGKTLIESRWLSEGSKFPLSPELVRVEVCLEKELGCDKREELTSSDKVTNVRSAVKNKGWEVSPNADTLHLAMDPRIPDHLEVMTFKTSGRDKDQTQWRLDDVLIESGAEFVFNLKKGEFVLQASSGDQKKTIKLYVH